MLYSQWTQFDDNGGFIARVIYAEKTRKVADCFGLSPEQARKIARSAPCLLAGGLNVEFQGGEVVRRFASF